MNGIGELESQKSEYRDTSALSPPWTTAVVFLLIVFLAMMVKISLSG